MRFVIYFLIFFYCFDMKRIQLLEKEYVIDGKSGGYFLCLGELRNKFFEYRGDETQYFVW